MNKKIFILVLVTLVNNVCAQKTLFDLEPNNTPEMAQLFKGEYQINGTFDEKNTKQDQDLYVWDLNDASADFFWDIELTGVPNRLTKVEIMQLDFDKNGKGVTRIHKLSTLSHNNGRDTVYKRNLVFSPGKYYIGLSYANDASNKNQDNPLSNAFSSGLNADEKALLDSGASVLNQNNYNLVFKKKKKIRPVQFKKDSIQPVKIWLNSHQGFLMSESEQWLSFKIDENQAKNNWDINGRASIGKNINLKLYSNDKKQIADSASNSEGKYSFNGLNLKAGEYFISIHTTTPNFMASISINKIGVHIEGSEIEPNDYLETSNQLKFDQTINGLRNKESDVDYYKLIIDENMADEFLKITLRNPNSTDLEVCLKDDQDTNLKCLYQKEDITLNNISLAIGEYYVYIYGGDVNSPYELKISNQGRRKSIDEAEPNDTFKNPAVMTNKRVIRGTFDGNEYDYFKFEVSGKPQLWTIQAVGNNISDITLYNSGGRSEQSMSYSGNNKRAKLTNLFLMPGTHVISLRGDNGKYLLRAFATGEPDPNFEIEPNDDKTSSLLLRFGDKKKGVVSESSDKDFYRFSLGNDENVQIKVNPPTDGKVRYILYWFSNVVGDKYSEIGKEMVFEGLLRAGDYYLSINPISDLVSDSAYSIELNRLPRYSCFQDCEPNDNHRSAQLLSVSSQVKGRNKTHGDEDWYRLPAFKKETQLSFKNNLPASSHYIRMYNYSDGKSEEIRRNYDKENLISHFIIPNGIEPTFRIYGEEENYDYSLIVDNVMTSVDFVNNNGIEIKLDEINKSVAAYHPYAQKIMTNVSLKNTTQEEKQLKIKATSSEFKWQLLKLPETIKLKPMQETTLPFEVLVNKNTIGMKSVRLSIAAVDDKNRVSETWKEVSVSGVVNPINSFQDQSIPVTLQGGINLAASSFGSKVSLEEIERLEKVGRGFEGIFDGYGYKGYGMIFREWLEKGNNYITVELAGKSPANVVGIILNPTSDSNPLNYLQEFEFQLSIDGVNYETVLKDKIKAIDSEQSFVLSQKTTAKYARLYFLSNTSQDPKKNISLGEWKVISDPMDNLSNGQGYNIASPKLGGYVAWADPKIDGKWNVSLLKNDDKVQYVHSNKKNLWQWVIGFHNQRIAKINRIELVKPEQTKDVVTFKKVTVSIAKESPTGPWEKLGTYDLPNLENTIELDQSVWARYVKFSVENNDQKRYFYPPEIIKVFEVPVSEKYFSILGEWGELSQSSFFERAHPLQTKANAKISNNNTKSQATLLRVNEQVFDQVQLEYSDKPDWYKFKVPAGKNTLKMNLTGDPTVNAVLFIEDQQGKEIPYVVDDSQVGQNAYTVTVEENQTYFIRIEEPPRSVIFSWDTSGSTSNYHGTIFQALSQFTEGVIADRDSVNFLPFGGDLLMDKWYGEPYLLKSILNNYDRNDGSSAAEKTIAMASQALSKRQGSKSIVLITDALTGDYQPLWSQLNAVKPRIFSIGLIQGDYNKGHEGQFDLMQSWSRVNNGIFDKITTNEDLEIAFDKAASKLRQPAKYGLKINSEFVEAPGPGSLVITEKQQSSSTAVELILDASGSMLKRLDGKRRINIAKEVLVKAVTEIIPAKTPLALRVFGDKEANACRTDLAIKLKPLEPNSAKLVLQNINAKNLAKTPIADSLAKISSDLKDHKGKKIVILVTDGEETCEGDPEKVIETLNKNGIDIRLNIVGFAIDDDELKQQFNQWSIQGGGKYFDSNNPESLKESVSNALKTPFSVFSISGELVQEGVVNGEALELPAGFYTIKVYGNEVKTYKNYQIKGEIEQVIKL